MLLAGQVYAQGGKEVTDVVGYLNVYEGGNGLRPVPGAGITLSFEKDSLNTISAHDGHFIFRKVPFGKAVVIVRHVSYETIVKELEVNEDLRDLILIMEEKAEQLKGARVQAKAQTFTFIGDTLQYNVAATQLVGQEETLGDVLGRLPGVTNEGGIRIMGEPLGRVYINNKLLFGDDPTAALNNLAANNIIRIKVYDQATIEDKRRRRISPKKERAINVETFTKMDKVVTALASAGIGTTAGAPEGEKLKYGVGAASNMFSEKTLLSATVRVDNLGKKAGISGMTNIGAVGGNDMTDLYAGAQVIKKYGDPELGKSLTANYAFSYGSQKQSSSSESIYKANGDVPDRLWRSKANSLSKTKSHQAYLLWSSPGEVIHYSTAFTFLASSNDDDSNIQSLRKTGDDLFQSTVGSSHRLDNYLLTLNSQISASRFTAMIEGQSGWNNGDYSRNETSSLYAGTTVSTPFGDSQRFSLMPVYILWANDSTSMDLKGKLGYERSYTHEERIKDGVPDPASSVVNLFNGYHASLDLHSRFVFRRKWSLEASVGAALDNIMQDIQLPYKDTPSKWFISPQFSLSALQMKTGARNVIMLSLFSRLPSSSMLSGYLNTNNPYFITRGNPDLGQGYRLTLSYTTTQMLGSGYSVDGSLQVIPTFNDIVRESTYFTQQTTLYGYEFLPGTTFDTYRNGNTANASASIGLRGPIPVVRIMGSLVLTYNFDADNGYLNGELSPTFRHRPAAKLTLRSNYSRNHKSTLSVTETYCTQNTQGVGESSFFNSDITLSHKSTFPFGLVLEGYYTFANRHSYSGVAPLIQHMLNLKAGVKVLPSKRGEISLCTYDVMNTWAGVKLSQGKDYVRMSSEKTPWRYLTLNFVYNFNSSQRDSKSKSGAFRNSGSLGDDYPTRPYVN